MSATVNVGTLEGLLRWKTDDAALNKSLDTVAKKADVSRSQLNRYNRELDQVTSAYRKVAASLDPLVAKQQRQERAQNVLNEALKRGVITVEQYRLQLARLSRGQTENLH